jgi:transcriptional regulator with XRE-family HTH domain
MSLADRLKELREKRGLTQDQIADLTKINRATYSNYESGRRKPPGKKLELLAKFYKVSVDYLLTGKENTDFDIADALETEKTTTFRGKPLNNEQKDLLIKFLQSFVSAHDQQQSKK